MVQVIVSVCECRLDSTYKTWRLKKKIDQLIKHMLNSKFLVSIAGICTNDISIVTILGVLFVGCSKNEEELINQTIRHFEPARPYVEVILVKNKI